MKTKGLIQVYTGNGKGKTTAAIGQAIRAKGAGLKVCFVYFHKNWPGKRSGEMKILEKIGIDVYCFVASHPGMNKKTTRACVEIECKKALEFIRDKLFKKHYDLMVLDEINIALRDAFVCEKELLSLLNKKPNRLEIVLTGRGAPKTIIKKAALVSRIKKVKHPFDSGIKMRKGIEY